MLQRPIIIVGAPRTGTTFLHRALSTHPQTKYLPYFEALDTMAPSTLSYEDIGTLKIEKCRSQCFDTTFTIIVVIVVKIIFTRSFFF